MRTMPASVQRFPSVWYEIYKRCGKTWEWWGGPFPSLAVARRVYSADYDDGSSAFIVVKSRLERVHDLKAPPEDWRVRRDPRDASKLDRTRHAHLFRDGAMFSVCRRSSFRSTEMVDPETWPLVCVLCVKKLDKEQG